MLLGALRPVISLLLKRLVAGLSEALVHDTLITETDSEGSSI